MNPIEVEIDKINDSVIEMIKLVKIQLQRSKEAFMNLDKDLASQIIHTESRVNSLELSIDKYCENTIARFCPVATDLRFIVSMLKINSDLERIGDYAAGIASYVEEMSKRVPGEVLKKTRTSDMFDLAVGMMEFIEDAYLNENSKKMKKLFSRDNDLNTINRDKSDIISDHLTHKPKDAVECLYVHSTIKKLERVGDHAKNIAENYIFFTDAKVMKHR